MAGWNPPDGFGGTGLLWKMHRSPERRIASERLVPRACFCWGICGFILLALLLVASFVLVMPCGWPLIPERLRPLLLGGVFSFGISSLSGVFDKGTLTYTHRVNQQLNQEPEQFGSRRWRWQWSHYWFIWQRAFTPNGVLFWQTPCRQRLHYDFGYYMQGLDAARLAAALIPTSAWGRAFSIHCPACWWWRSLLICRWSGCGRGCICFSTWPCWGACCGAWPALPFEPASGMVVVPPGVGLCPHAGNAARRADQHDHRVWLVPALHLGGIAPCLEQMGLALGIVTKFRPCPLPALSAGEPPLEPPSTGPGRGGTPQRVGRVALWLAAIAGMSAGISISDGTLAEWAITPSPWSPSSSWRAG